MRDRNGDPVDQRTATIEQLIESGTCFAGTPDDVYNQIKALHDSVGGFGNLLMFGLSTSRVATQAAAAQ